MSARILIVDDIPANVRLLEAKLAPGYFQIITGKDGFEAIEKAQSEEPDIILLDVMMPGMDGFEACRRLKADEATWHIPVVMVTALEDRESRLNGLACGADDFLSKPVDEFSLIARVHALTRYKIAVDELRKREASGKRMGVIDGGQLSDNGIGARVLTVDSNMRRYRAIERTLTPEHTSVHYQADQADITQQASLDLILVSLLSDEFDGLRLVAHFKSQEVTRDIPIIAISDNDNLKNAAKALELGASDLIMAPLDAEELLVRVRTQMRRKRYMDALRTRLDSSMELAIIDPLTQLYNRRFLEKQLPAYLQRTTSGSAPLSIVIADIDMFKHINDTYGHDVGDKVLVELSERMQQNIRPHDYACRMGGEEFVVIMPNADMPSALMVAERLRVAFAREMIEIDDRIKLQATMSLGVASVSPGETVTAAQLFKNADQALYQAKNNGRNQVISADS